MFKYPYGDSQQLNLDWILRKLKELEGAIGQQITEDLEVISNALIAESYSSSNAYNRSDVVYHDGKLYRANVNIPTPGESWNPAHWDEIMLGDTVANLVRYVGSLSNNQVFNSSTVPGTHTSNALDNLKSDIDQVSGFHVIPQSYGSTDIETVVDYMLAYRPAGETGTYITRRDWGTGETTGYFGNSTINVLISTGASGDYVCGLVFSDNTKQFATFRKYENTFEEKHYEFTSNAIENNSNVTGSTVTDALNTLGAFGTVPLAVSKGGSGATTSLDAITEFVGSAFSVVTDTISAGVTKKYSGNRNGFRGLLFIFGISGIELGMYMLSIINASWRFSTIKAPSSADMTVTTDSTGITIANNTSGTLGIRFMNFTSAQYKVLPEITII